MAGTAHYEEVEAAEGGRVLCLSGPYLVSTIGPIDQDLGKLDGPFDRIDIAGVEEIDTVGAWSVGKLAQDHDAEVTGASDRARRLMAAVQVQPDEAAVREPRPNVVERIGQSTVSGLAHTGEGSKAVVGFLGATMIGLFSSLWHWRRFRGLALVRQMELVGVAALPIIGLMSFLIGIVIAQQGAVQLAQFGAETLTVNLVGRITLRELGVLMTAIMVAGRSGSAFAAQIGTMKLTEEVDAMRTIGISPIEALVVPRVLAVIIMMPLLGFYACAVAIIGGAVVADLTLGIPFLSFLARVQEVVPIYDLWVGLIKAPLFGLIIGLTGCYQGMQVAGNSEDVGKRTTKAVVQAIFAVIVLDAFFAVFFTEVGWA